MVHDLRTIGFQELLAFITVVKQGGITAAANKLGVAKSAISGQVTKLEDKLKVKLLNRHSRRVSLTKEGEHLLPRIESLVAEGEKLFAEAEEEENLPQGMVKIAATPEFALWVLAYFAPIVKQHFPDINLIFKTAYDFEDLQDPSFDLAFRINRVKDERLVAREIGTMHRYIYAQPNLAEIDKLQHPSQLTSYPCLGFSDTTTKRVWSAINPETKEELNIEINAVSGARNFSMLGQLAAVGVGISYLPSFVVADQVKNGTLVRVLQPWQSKPAHIYLAYRQGVDRIARVKAVLELAKKVIPELITQYS